MVNYYHNHLIPCNHIIIPFPYSLSTDTPYHHHQETCLEHLENYIWVMSAAMSSGNIYSMKQTKNLKNVNPIPRKPM